MKSRSIVWVTGFELTALKLADDSEKDIRPYTTILIQTQSLHRTSSFNLCFSKSSFQMISMADQYWTLFVYPTHFVNFTYSLLSQQKATICTSKTSCSFSRKGKLQIYALSWIFDEYCRTKSQWESGPKYLHNFLVRPWTGTAPPKSSLRKNFIDFKVFRFLLS